MSGEQARHALRVESGLSVVMRIDVVGAAEAVLLAMDAENDAVLLHRFEDFAANEVVHGDAVLGIRGAVGRVVFAGAKETALGTFSDHRGGGLGGQVKRNDELLKGIRPRSAEIGGVALDGPGIVGGRAGDP